MFSTSASFFNPGNSGNNSGSGDDGNDGNNESDGGDNSSGGDSSSGPSNGDSNKVIGSLDDKECEDEKVEDKEVDGLDLNLDLEILTNTIQNSMLPTLTEIDGMDSLSSIFDLF